MPKFSVIIPVYKVEQYLEKCVKSVLAQSYSDFEIILVDDGSPDSCPQLCDELEIQDSRIKVIHKSNGGLSSARNAGLDIACGELIYFLDSDDSIELGLLEDAAVNMTPDVDIWSFGYTMYSEDGTEIKSYSPMGGHIFLESNMTERTDFLCNQLCLYHPGWEAWKSVYRRSLIEKHKLRFADNSVVFSEDLFFMLCYCAHIRHLAVTEKKYYRYLQRESSIMGENKNADNTLRFFALSKAVYDYCLREAPELCAFYPAINMALFGHTFKVSYCTSKNKARYFYQQTHGTDEYCKFVLNQLKLFVRNEKLRNIVKPHETLDEAWNIARYCISGNYSVLLIRNRILYRKYDAKPSKLFHSDKHTVFVLGTETSGNLGDVAINIAIEDFIKKARPDSDIVEISCEDYFQSKERLQKQIKEDHLIVSPGGGNLGDAYPSMENPREDMVKTWANQKKIIFPQTIYFENEDSLSSATFIYSKGGNMTLYVREKGSLQTGEQLGCRVKICPDIVLSMDLNPQKQETVERKGVLLCLRSDIESKLQPADVRMIEEYLEKRGVQYGRTDTHLIHPVGQEDRQVQLNKLLKQLQGAKLIITDRLHGMILSAVSGTPCIALSNYNHKVKDTYDWISYLPYVRYADTISQAIALVPELMEMDNCVFRREPLQPYFDELAREIRK